MKVKELILALQSEDPELEARIAVYDCGGFNDSYSLEDIEARKGVDYRALHFNIYPGCDTHNKWSTANNCPVEQVQKELIKIEEIQKTLDYYKNKMEDQLKRFSERNKK